MSRNFSPVDRPVLVTVVFGLLVILGALMAFQLSVALYPEIKPPLVVVSTTYPGAGPETVEKAVTKVLESGLMNVGSLKSMTSTSAENSSQITLNFNYGVNLDAATNDVRDKLGMIRGGLPQGVRDPQIFQYDPSTQSILDIALRGNRSPEELRKLAVDLIKEPLQRVAGVSDASVTGGRDRALRVDVSQDRLDAYGLTLTALAQALAAQNLELGGGRITEGTRNFSIRTVGDFKNVAEVANTVVAQRGNQGIRLADVATVALGLRDEEGSVYLNGQPGVYVAIKKRSGGNTVKIAAEVKAALPGIEKTLPPDVRLEVVSDNTGFITKTVETLMKAAGEAVFFAMLVIFLFLRSAKTTFIIGLSIPISIGITLLVMAFCHLTLNIFTMTGLILGVGMIVDDSIVVMENIVRYRERGMKNRMAALVGSAEMRNAVVASTLTTVFVFLPILIFKDQLEIIGLLFQDMIFTIVISLLSSLAVGLFLVPVLTTRYLPLVNRHETPLRNPVLVVGDRILAGGYGLIERAYRRALAWSLRHRAVVVVGVVLALAGTFVLSSGLKFAFAPSSEESTVSLSLTLPVGTPLAETKEVLRRLEDSLRAEARGVQSVIRTSGEGGANLGSLTIVLPDRAHQQDSPGRIKQILRGHYFDFPGATFSLPGSDFSGGAAPVSIQIEASDLGPALDAAQAIVEAVKARVPEATEVRMDLNKGLPQVAVSIDRQRAAALGVDITTVANEIKASVDGVVATQYQAQGEDTPILVVLREEDRRKVLDLNRIAVTSSSGAKISLVNFATLERGNGPVEIAHKNKARTIQVSANLKPGATAPEVEAKVRRVVADLVLGASVRISYGGETDEMVKMGQTLLIVFLLAILLVFGVMAAQYESFKNPIINLFTIPLMAIGVVGVYLATGQPLSLFSGIGVVMLVGLVVKNGIVMVDYMGLLRARGLAVYEAGLEAGVARLRPVLMTSLTAILGMMPLALGTGEGSELVQPIGVTVIGGLTSATLITLFFIPVLYSLFNGGIREAT